MIAVGMCGLFLMSVDTLVSACRLALCKMGGRFQAMARTEIGWRVWLLAGVAALAVASPPAAIAVGPIAATAVVFTARPISIRFDLPTITATAFAAFAALSTLWSLNQPVTFRAAIVVASVAITFIGVRQTVKTYTHVQVVALGYLAGCVALTIRLAIMLVQVDNPSRINLPDVNANYAGYALVLGFALLPLFWKQNWIASLVVASVILTGILIAGTRSVLIGAILMLLWVGVTRITKTPPIKTLLVLVIAASIVITTGIADKASLLLEGALGRPTGDWSGRLVLWPLARQWWLDHFIAGSGIGSFQSENPLGVGAHSLFLTLGVDMGLVGVALFVLLVWSSLRNTQPFLIGCFITVTAASYLTGHWETAPAAWVVLGLLSATPAAGLCSGKYSLMQATTRR